ncbi:MAG: signal peptidase I [Kiritimatiellia bacterium]
MNFFQRRQIRKAARAALSHAKHLRNMREDIMKPDQLHHLGTAEDTLRAAMKSREPEKIKNAAGELTAQLEALSPRVSCPVLREYFEILVVAVAVAMAFRTYFIQPFKIPTGSMQPTLYGIHSFSREYPDVFDKMPLKLVKWIVTGRWYREVRVTEGGILEGPRRVDGKPSVHEYRVGARIYRLPKDAELRPGAVTGEYVSAGTVLWRGITVTGDHVFVDKVRWNFAKPARGNVIVFATDGIPALPPHTHYIKRLIGLPGENVRIVPPNVLINGKVLRRPPAIARIASTMGYRPAGGHYSHAPEDIPLRSPADILQIPGKRYFALGDNTSNSKDGRIWGTVPEESLVGPAFMVYWPFLSYKPATGTSSRWGPILAE